MQFADRGDNLANFRVCEFQRIRHYLFGNFQSARFHHHDRFVRTGHNQIHLAGLLLGNSWIHHQLAFDQSDANRRNRLVKRNFRNEQRRRGRRHRNHVGIIFAVRRKHHCNNLGFVGPSFGEQRPQRPVSQARSQNLALRRSSFALKKSAGNLSRRIGVLAIIHGQGQKIFLSRLIVHAGRGQHHRVSITRHHRSMRLASHLARLKRQCASAYFQTYFFKHQTRPFFSDSSEADFRYERQLSGTTSRKDIAKKNERNSTDPTFSRVRRLPDNRPLRKPRYLRKLSRSTISRYRFGSRRFR